MGFNGINMGYASTYGTVSNPTRISDHLLSFDETHHEVHVGSTAQTSTNQVRTILDQPIR